MMNKLREAEKSLESAIESFSRVWAESDELWNDEAKRYFESEFVSFTLTETPTLLQKVQELAETVEQARREVE